MSTPDIESKIANLEKRVADIEKLLSKQAPCRFLNEWRTSNENTECDRHNDKQPILSLRVDDLSVIIYPHRRFKNEFI